MRLLNTICHGLLIALLCACAGHPLSILELDESIAPADGMRRIRDRQMLRYRTHGSDALQTIPFSWTEFVDGQTWSTTPPELASWLESECGGSITACSSSSPRVCGNMVCMTTRAACQANIMLEIAAATTDVEIQSVTIPPQNREVRAALAELAVRLITTSVLEFEPNTGWHDDYECNVRAPEQEWSTLDQLVSGLRDVYEIGREASERAVADYLALADELAGTDLGVRGVVEVRLHAARFLIGRGAVAVPAGLGVCTDPPLTPQARRALDLLRDSGVAPAALRSSATTREILESHVIPRLAALRTGAHAHNATTFLRDNALRTEDFESARGYLVSEYLAFARDETVLTTGPVVRHAATLTRPIAPPAAWYASRAKDLGLGAEVELLSEAGAPLRPDLNGIPPSAADLAHALRQIATEFRVGSTNSSLPADRQAFSDAAVRLEQVANTDHEGWFYAGYLPDDMNRSRAMVLSRANPADLIIVRNASDLRCATTGLVEGQPCRWQDMDVRQATASASEQNAWRGRYAFIEARATRLSNDPQLQMAVFPDIGAPSDSLFLLRRRRGATAGHVGAYEPWSTGAFRRITSDGIPVSFIERFHVAPALETWAGELLTPSSEFCGRPRVSCAGTTTDGRLPLEDDLTDDGDAHENSWRRYLSLATRAAQEADRLADEALGVELEIATRTEQAAQQLEDLCGDGVDLSALSELAVANPHLSVLELIDSLPDSTNRRVLLRCMSDEAVLPWATLGNRELCLWAPANDPSHLCGYPGTPDLACPRWAEATTDSPCRVPAATGGQTFVPIRLSGAALLQIVEASSRPNNTIPEPGLCAHYRSFRHAVGRNDRVTADALFDRVFRSSGVFSGANVSALVSSLTWTAEPLQFSRLTLGRNTVVNTGNLSGGPSTIGLCNPARDEMLRAAAGCSSDDEQSLLCSSYDCSNDAARHNLNLRLMRAAMAARWLGGKSLTGFTQVACGRTNHSTRYSVTESYTGDPIGYYTRTDSKPGIYYCDPDPLDGVFPNFWGVGCETGCALRNSYRHGVRFVEMQGDRPYGNSTIDGQAISDAQLDGQRLLRRLRDNSPLDSSENLWTQISEGRGLTTNRALPWFLADECGDGYCGLSALLPNARNHIDSTAVLDALELICMAAVSEDPNAALTLPLTISSSDIDTVSNAVERYADGIRDQATLMVLRNVPAQFAEEFRGGQVATTPSAYGGDLGEAAGRARAALLALRSAPESIAEQVAGIGRDVVQIKNEVLRLGYEEELIITGMAREVATAMSQCFQALASASMYGYGSAAAACGMAALQISQIFLESELRQKILESRVESTLTNYIDKLAGRGAAIRHAGDVLLDAQNSANTAFEQMVSKRREARRSFSRALQIADPHTAAVLQTSTKWRTRLATVRQRYERARRDAIRMAWLARRSIEARFGVELSSITREMSLVAAPATWEAEVCRLDGFDIGEVTDAVGSRYIGEYVAKLEAFVESYRLDFPFIDGRDISIVSLRDDIFQTRDECLAPSSNLLRSSNELRNAVWSVRGCLEEGGEPSPSCLDLRPIDVALTPQYWFGDTGDWQPFEVAFDAEACDSAGCPTLEQTVAVVAGEYLVSGFLRFGTFPTWNGDGAAYATEITRAYNRAMRTVEFEINNDPIPQFDRDNYWDSFQSHGGTLSVLSDAHGDYWVRFSRRIFVAENGTITVRVVRAVENENYWARVGGLSLMSAPEGSEHHLPRFVSSDADGLSGQAVCEDVHGDEFRRSAWRRGCLRLCPDGFSQVCADREARNHCYWETEFVISQQAIDAGTVFSTGGFARGNFNYRIDELGVNFVGTGLRQCGGVNAPGPCYAGGYWTYSVEHVGPYMVRDYWGGDYQAPLFTGRIEHGRGLANERYLTNPVSSSDRAMMQDYMHRQLRGRPLSGLYRLKVWDAEDVAFERLEDVQLVLGYRYWTRTR